jgi:hypothetical protein
MPPARIASARRHIRNSPRKGTGAASMRRNIRHSRQHGVPDCELGPPTNLLQNKSELQAIAAAHLYYLDACAPSLRHALLHAVARHTFFRTKFRQLAMRQISLLSCLFHDVPVAFCPSGRAGSQEPHIARSESRSRVAAGCLPNATSCVQPEKPGVGIKTHTIGARQGEQEPVDKPWMPGGGPGWPSSIQLRKR